LTERYHIAVDLDRIVGQLSVGEQQRVEIPQGAGVAQGAHPRRSRPPC